MIIAVASGTSAPSEDISAPAQEATVATPAEAASVPAAVLAVEPKEKRLVLVIETPTKLSPLFWLTTTSASVQHRPMTKAGLIMDRFSGELVPGLATEWEQSPDGKTMTLILHEGVSFHFRMGEGIAEDPENPRFLVTQEESIHRHQGYFTNIHDIFY